VVRREPQAEHLLVEEQDGCQGLPLGAGRHVTIGGQVREPSLHPITAQRGRVLEASPTHELLVPAHVGPLGGQAVVPDAAGRADLGLELGLPGGVIGHEGCYRTGWG
jgi:hypothetical protein